MMLNFHNDGLRYLLLLLVLKVPLPGWAQEGKPSITLTPAVIMVQAKGGQTTTQTLKLDNNTGGQFGFELEALDVVVRDGKRTFVQAGEIPGSIAQSAIFTPKSLLLHPGESAKVQVTVTIPENPTVRGAVFMFRGTTLVGVSGSVGMTGSVGALFTLTMSNHFKVENYSQGKVAISDGKIFSLSQPLVNTGDEPVVPKGVLAIMTQAGTLVGKVPISGQRLLPGEQLDFKAEYPMPLKPGKYRALTSLKYEGGVMTSEGDFVVP